MSKLLTILGPTASGKTELACHVALELGAQIISADSRQVYRGMDIGTGKDIEEYTINGTKIPYHLIDIKPAGYRYNIAEFQLDFRKALKQIESDHQIPILCGGSGMYIEAALEGSSFLGIPPNEQLLTELKGLNSEELERAYDKIANFVKAELNPLTDARKRRAVVIDEYIKVHPDWKPRTFEPLDYCIVGVAIDRDFRREKITKRLSHRLNHGMIEEAQQLLDKGVTHEQLQFYGLEYKWLSRFLLQEISKRELFEGLNTAIHQFSKRQMTWFRRMEKHGYQINWVKAELSIEEKVKQSISAFKQFWPSI